MGGLVLKIRSEYDELSKSNKSIADYILNNLEEFIDLTAIDIGKKSQTSSASVTRFAKKIGFEGLDDMKREAVKDIQLNSQMNSIDPIISENDSTQMLCEKIELLVNNSVKDLFYQLDMVSLDEAISALKAAETIYVVGIGASSLPAYDLYHKLNRINKRTFFDFDSHMILEFMHYAKKDDVLIAFSYSGESKEIIYPAKIAKENGIKVISVTRAKESPLSRKSDYVLQIPNDERTTRVSAMSSKYNSLIISDILYLGAIKHDLKSIEKDLIATSLLTKGMKNKEKQ